jgi:L-fuconate dehydratase
VQHLSIFDYLCVADGLEGRLIEYVDHLHEHFLDPVVIVNGCYQVPDAPGCSITMRPEALADYVYPTGPAWKS